MVQIFTSANNFDTVNVKLGESFLVKLREEPAERIYSKETELEEGPIWKMEASTGLRLIRSEFIPDIPDTTTVPGVHEWEYEAFELGDQKIEGKYPIYRFGGEEKFRLRIKVEE
ncbi:MAG: protease inhibitor I42 family protein [Methanosarcinaceae archaeon]|nr:protease inhibitor I42 family protein [Methanosarcinaceae archaeon]MDD4331009.1 protease inhibitor I42 family protein [Methanosarcinaceae archaeon]MDD4749077.1 protease inhibitor I42 family protein [Methanosarcinaceae archaeon]